MDITIEDVIDLCEDVDITEAQIENFALLKVSPGARYHVCYGKDSEHFLAFTQNYRDMFAGNQYLGGVFVSHVKQAYFINFFYIFAPAIVLSDSAAASHITPIGGPLSHMVMSNCDGKYLREGFKQAYRYEYDTDRERFEENWKEIANQSFKMSILRRQELIF